MEIMHYNILPLQDGQLNIEKADQWLRMTPIGDDCNAV